MADADSRFPWWAAIAAGAGVLLLLLATIMTFSADSLRNGEDFATDPDNARSANTMDLMSTLFMSLGRYAVGGAFLAAGAFGPNPGWARVAFAIVGAGALVDVDLL